MTSLKHSRHIGDRADRERLHVMRMLRAAADKGSVPAIRDNMALWALSLVAEARLGKQGQVLAWTGRISLRCIRTLPRRNLFLLSRERAHTTGKRTTRYEIPV
jgi:hypothetical protein